MRYSGRKKGKFSKRISKVQQKRRYGCGYQKKRVRIRLKTVHVLSIMCPYFQGPFTMSLCHAFWKPHSRQLVLSARNSFACVPRQLKPFRTKGKEHRGVNGTTLFQHFVPPDGDKQAV